MYFEEIYPERIFMAIFSILFGVIQLSQVTIYRPESAKVEEASFKILYDLDKYDP